MSVPNQEYCTHGMTKSVAHCFKQCSIKKSACDVIKLSQVITSYNYITIQHWAIQNELKQGWLTVSIIEWAKVA